MAKSKVLKFVGCAALAGVSYAAGRAIGFFSGVGWAAATNKTEPEAFAKATDESIALLKEDAPSAYKEVLRKFPKLEETDNQPED
jgi:hypothetical protein